MCFKAFDIFFVLKMQERWHGSECKNFLKTFYGTLKEARLIALHATYKHVSAPLASGIVVAARGMLPLALYLQACMPEVLVLSRDGGPEPWHLSHGEDVVMLYTIYVSAGSPPTLLLDYDRSHKALLEKDNITLLLLDGPLNFKPPVNLFAATQRCKDMFPSAGQWDVFSIAAAVALSDFRKNMAQAQASLVLMRAPAAPVVAMRRAESGADPRRDFAAFMLLAERHPCIKFMWISDLVGERVWNNVTFRRPSSTDDLAGGITYFLARIGDAPFAFSLLLRGIRLIFIEDCIVPLEALWSPEDGGLVCGALRHRRLQHLGASDLVAYRRTACDLEAVMAYIDHRSRKYQLPASFGGLIPPIPAIEQRESPH